MHKLTRKVGAILATLALALSGLLSATPALAETTGTFTVTSTNAEFAGKTVTIYKMFSASGVVTNESGEATSATYALETAWNGFFKSIKSLNLTDESTNDEISAAAYNYVSGLSETARNEFAKDASNWAKNSSNGITATTTADASTTSPYAATFSGLGFGYYVVSPASGSTSSSRHTDAMLVNLVKETGTTLELKSAYPTVEKKADGKKGTSAQIGQSVTYTLTSTVPDMSEYNSYTLEFHDTLSKGLTYDSKTGVSVTVDGNDYDSSKYSVKPGEYNSSNGTKLEIDFTDAKTNLADYAGKTIVITYKATVNENAEVESDTQSNSAYVKYSNDPSSDSTGTSTPSETHTYDFKFDVTKVGENNEVLEGATFQLKDKSGNVIKLVQVAAGSDTATGVYRVAKTSDESGAVETVTTTKSGKLEFQGLAATEYQLEETAAPSGYNKLSKPVRITIDANYNTDGTLASHTVKKDSDEQASANDTITVQNNKGNLLPTTGGMGTALITFGSAALVALGVVWMVVRRRNASRA